MRKALTLVELLVVITILFLLLFSISYLNQPNKTREAARSLRMSIISAQAVGEGVGFKTPGYEIYKVAYPHKFNGFGLESRIKINKRENVYQIVFLGGDLPPIFKIGDIVNASGRKFKITKENEVERGFLKSTDSLYTISIDEVEPLLHTYTYEYSIERQPAAPNSFIVTQNAPIQLPSGTYIDLSRSTYDGKKFSDNAAIMFKDGINSVWDDGIKIEGVQRIYLFVGEVGEESDVGAYWVVITNNRVSIEKNGIAK